MWDIWDIVDTLSSIPFDILLYLNETRESIDWDAYASSVGLPLGVVLLCISFACNSAVNYYNSTSTKSCNLVFDTPYYEYEHLKASFLARRNDYFSTEFTNQPHITRNLVRLLSLVSSAVVAGCIINTYKVVTRTRRYSLLYCDKKPSSRSIVRSSFASASYLASLAAYVYRLVRKLPENPNEPWYWQLNQWDPSKFSLYLFVTLNPVNVFLLHTLNYTSPIVVIPSVGFVSVTLHFLIHDFLQLIEDRQLVYSETFKEYNNKYVKPMTTRLLKDAVVDATLGPHDTFLLKDVKAHTFTRSKVFTTHDAKGKPVTEYLGAKASNPNATFEKPVFSDSNKLLDRLRLDNENLYIRNQELQKQLSRLQDPELSVLETESESEREDIYRKPAWKSMNTPIIPVKFENIRRTQRGGSTPVHRTPSPDKRRSRVERMFANSQKEPND